MSWRWVVVKMTVYGHVVDPAYSRMLIKKTDLPLTDILCLDRIQKKLPVPVATIRLLRRCGLIEGRQPNIHVSAVVAQATASKAEYIRTRAQDDVFDDKLIIDYLTKFGKASRACMGNGEVKQCARNCIRSLGRSHSYCTHTLRRFFRQKRLPEK